MGPTRLEKAVWQGRGATFRARTSQDNSKEVLGMAKVLSLEETTAQWCQIREGEPTAETAQLCQKEESTARECQAAWSARRRRQSERIKNAAAFRRRQAQGQRKQVAKMRKKGAAAIPQTEEAVSVSGLITNITTVVRIVAKIQGDLTALQQ